MNTEGLTDQQRALLADEILYRVLDQIQAAQNDVELAAQALCSASGKLGAQWNPTCELYRRTKALWHTIEAHRAKLARIAAEGRQEPVPATASPGPRERR